MEGIGGGNESNVWHLPFLLYPAEPGTPAELRRQYYKLVEQVFPLFLTVPFLSEKESFMVLSLVYEIHLICASTEFNETCMPSCSSIASLLANSRKPSIGGEIKIKLYFTV